MSVRETPRKSQFWILDVTYGEHGEKVEERGGYAAAESVGALAVGSLDGVEEARAWGWVAEEEWFFKCLGNEQ